jgi:hypothetical protein
MAQLRGGTQLWSSVSLAGTGVSPLAVIGSDPYVVVYLSNEGAISTTYNVEVAATANPDAGRNALDGTASGGLTWYTLTNHTGLVVAAGIKMAFDLSPFGPQFLRLVRTDGGAANAVTAFVTSVG